MQGSPHKAEMFGRLGLLVLIVGGVLVLSLAVAVTTLALGRSSSQAVPTTTSTTSGHNHDIMPTTPAPATTSVPTRPPPAPTTSTAIPEDTYANSVDEVCQQFVPQLTQLVTTGIDGGMFNESEVKSLVSQMLSDISAIPAPSGEGPTVNTWIVDWEDSWDAALSENTRLFTSDIRTADTTARLLGLGPQCM